MKFIAHRGLRGEEFKENSLEAFQNAINSSIMSGFEFDVRETKDKQFIVNHNIFVKNDLIKLNKMKYLKKAYQLPSLSDVLKLETNKIMLVEVKDFSINYSRFVKLINSYSNKNIYIMSFHNKVIEKLKNYHVNAKLGILNYILNTEEDYEYDFICLLNNLTTKEIIERYHEKGIEVFIYGVINEEKDIIHRNTYYIVDKEPSNFK